MVRLSREQKIFYEQNGYIVLKNVISEELLSEISTEYDKLFERTISDGKKVEMSWQGQRLDGDRGKNSPYTVKGIHNLQNHHAIFGQLMSDPNLLDCLEDIMETKNIMLLYSKAHFKPPGVGGDIPMHQDASYYPHERHSPVAVFLNLEASGPESGGLCLFPGSHKLGLLDVEMNEGGFYPILDEKYSLSQATPLTVDRGDIIVFSYLTIHGSPRNTSKHQRRSVIIEYVSADDKRIIQEGTPQDKLYMPGYGWLFRGVNVHKTYNTANRFNPA